MNFDKESESEEFFFFLVGGGGGGGVAGMGLFQYFTEFSNNLMGSS